MEKLRQERDSVAYLQSTIWEEKEAIFETSITNDLHRSPEILEDCVYFVVLEINILIGIIGSNEDSASVSKFHYSS